MSLLGDRLEHETLHTRDLPPVLLVRLQRQLDTGVEGGEPVGARPHGRPLEAVVADLLDVSLGHDPAGAGGEASVIGHEVGPRLLEPETDPARIHDLDHRDLFLHQLRRRAPITLEGELHVVGSDGISVVELHASAKDEFVDEAVLRHAPRFGQARRHGVPRHRLDHRVVQRVEDHERCTDPGGLSGIEPGRGERDVNGPGHLTLGAGRGRRGADNQGEGNQQQREESHGRPP